MNETIKRIYELQVKVAQESLNSLKQLQAHAGGVERSLSGLLGTLKSFGAGLLGGLSIGLVVDQIRDTIKVIDELDKQAGRLKMPVSEFAALKYAANQADLELGELTTGLKFLQKAIAEAQIQPGGKQGRLLEALGVDPRSGASMTEQLLKLSSGFQKVTDAALKTKAELVLFGRSGTAFTEFLAQGPEAIQKFVDAQKGMNAATDSVLENQRKFEEQSKKLAEQVTNLKITLVDGLLPALTRVATFFNETVKKEELTSWGEALGNIFESSVQKGAAWREEIRGLVEVFAGLRDFFKTDTLRNAGPALDRMAEGWRKASKAAETTAANFAMAGMALEMTTPSLAANNKALNASVEAVNKSDAANKKLRDSLAETGKEAERQAKREADAYAKRVEGLEETLAKLTEVNNENSEAAKIMREIERGTLKVVDAENSYIVSLARRFDAMRNATKAAEDWVKQLEQVAESQTDAAASTESFQQRMERLTAGTRGEELARLRRQIEEINEALLDTDDVDYLGRLNENLIKAQDQIRQLTNPTLTDFDKAMLNLADRVDGYGKSMAGMFVDFATGANDAATGFSEFAVSLLRDLAQMTVQMLIFDKLVATLRATIKGWSIGAGAGIGDTIATAQGAAFDSGNVIPFARGGVVHRPTVFPMAQGWGLMGEAGPEAVMPLGRTASGELGVKGGGVNVTVINNASGARASAEEQRQPDGTVDVRVMIEDVVDGALKRGRFDGSMREVYGSARKGRM